MNRKSLGLIACTGLIIIMNSGAKTPLHQDDDQSLQSLRIERIKTLESITEFERVAFAEGTSTFENVAMAEQELLVARLENASNSKQRIKIREKALQVATNLEKQIADRVRMGDLPNVAMLKVKSNRLKTEIDLKLEKQKK